MATAAEEGTLKAAVRYRDGSVGDVDFMRAAAVSSPAG
jgi:hypothetical protein